MQKLYYNGTIITVDDNNPQAEAVLVDNNEILYVGEYSTACQIAAENANHISLKGHTLMPAFIDTHSHFSMVAQSMRTVSLSKAISFQNMIEMLRNHIISRRPSQDQIIIGFGYDLEMLKEKAHPTKAILDQASSEIPIFIMHVSAHMGCANEAFLAKYGISADTQDIPGGVIGRMEGSNEPNGYFEENALGLVQTIIQPYLELDVDAINQAQDLYLRNGVTVIQDGATSQSALEAFKQFASKEQLKVHLLTYPMVNVDATSLFAKNPSIKNQYANRLKLAGYKLILDGSPQAKTAWMSEPYINSGNYCAYPWFKDNEVVDALTQAIEDNQQILVHCNGDASADQFLNSYNTALLNANNSNKHLLRPVMIHCQTVREDQLDLMKNMSVIPSIFVGHTYYWGDVHLRNLGLTRGNRISPVKSALNRGLCFNFHQDSPVTDPNMLHSIWCAVNRVSKTGQIIGADQCIDVENAIKAVTINAAYMYGEENIRGSITKGKKADLIILDQNPLQIDKTKIRDIHVLETIKEGEPVWKYGSNYTCTA